MTTAPPVPAGVLGPAGGPPRSALRSRVLPVALAAAVALGVLARLWSPSALWLDEALSVAIARRPVPELLEALRRDGSPPLYYLLLHAWTEVLGGSAAAVRALSGLCSLATLPLVWRIGLRLGGRRTASAALLLLAVSPFAVRYATEARMYALVQLLVAAGLLALLRVLERPAAPRLVALGLLAGLLALTHYWGLFLLVATAGLLLVLRRGPDPVPARRALAALAAGAVLFVPWLPAFAFQVQHTGAPWAAPARLVDLYYSLAAWSGGGTGPAVLLTLTVLALAVLAVAGRPLGSSVVLGGPPDRTALALLLATVLPVLLGLVVAIAGAGTFSPRYTSVALVPALLLAALGLRALPERGRTAVLVLVALCGLHGSLPQLWSTSRTQAGTAATLLQQGVRSGDVVAYCPDQLGPPVSRLLRPGVRQVVYPTGLPPGPVDWVDYAERNASASPQAFARRLDARTAGAVWLVSGAGYRTLEGQCEAVREALAALRGKPQVLQRERPRFEERIEVAVYAGTAG